MWQLRSTTFSLLVANIFVAIYALWHNMSVADLVIVYWIESVFIIFFGLAKETFLALYQRNLEALIATAFFCFVMVSMSAGHLLGIIGYFGDETLRETLRSTIEPGLYKNMVHVIMNYSTAAVFVLCLHHLFSLAINFFWKKEYQWMQFGFYLFYPLPRIFTVHLFIMIGGAIQMIIGLPTLVGIFVLTILKTGSDIVTHQVLHKAKDRVQKSAQTHK